MAKTVYFPGKLLKAVELNNEEGAKKPVRFKQGTYIAVSEKPYAKRGDTSLYLAFIEGQAVFLLPSQFKKL